MSVAVIIPTYDRRALLPRALESVRSQSLPPDEVIVIDDGSRDGTAEMVRREYPEITLLEQPRAGVSAARNRGIEHSHGDWIALLDSDDAWLPDKLEAQLDALAAEPNARICHTDEIWIRNGVRVNPRKKHAKHGGWIFEDCLPLCCMSPSSILVHRSVFERVGMFDESLPACEDYDMWLRVTCRYPVLLVQRPLVIKHGGHADQLSRTVWGLDRFRIRALQKILDDEALSARQRAAVSTVLRDRIGIFGDGAAKRGRTEEAHRYRAMLRRLGPERGDHGLDC